MNPELLSALNDAYGVIRERFDAQFTITDVDTSATNGARDTAFEVASDIVADLLATRGIATN